MLEAVNHTIFAWLADPSHLGALPSGLLIAVAQGPIFALPALLVALWLLGSPQDRSAAVTAALAGVLALLIAASCSALVFHPRPFMEGLAANSLDHASDSSFPSDHATLFFGLAFAFLFRPASWPVCNPLLLVTVGVCVGLARVALAAHYPLDIVGAALIGRVAAYAVTRTPLAIVATKSIWVGVRCRSLVLRSAPAG